MAGHSRSKNGVASLAYVPAIHVFMGIEQDVDARHKAGHDESLPTIRGTYSAGLAAAAARSAAARFSTTRTDQIEPS
jgi:hypothetical protein